MAKRLIVITLCVLILVACSGGKTASKTTSVEMNDDVLNLISNNNLAVNSITAQGGFGSGYESFSASLTNPAEQKISVKIPCGLVFTPSDSSLQPMMVIQEVTAEIEPGETTELNAYVVCIDAETGVPAVGDAYTFGYIETGKLKSLADCLCGTQDTMDDPMGVQFAVWAVSNPSGTGATQAMGGEAFKTLIKDTLGDEEIPEELSNMLENLPEIPGFDNAQAWLDRCGIE